MPESLGKSLATLISAFESGQAHDLKKIGNMLIEEAAERNSAELARLSAISYALYKILSKDHFVKSPQWPKMAINIRSELLKAGRAAEKNDIGAFGRSLESAVKDIQGIDSELSNYARNIYEKARVKQASTAYAAGLSLRQAAELTGADRKDLQRYIGITRIHDEQPSGMGIAQRMEQLRKVLGR